MSNEEKKQQPQQKSYEGFAQDGLDTSKAKRLLEEASKSKNNGTKAVKK